MAKTIVTHVSPDIDGIGAIWLLKKLHPDFRNAKLAFVPAGDSTYNNEPVDSNSDVLHVDTGLGKFDHHLTNNFTCGTKLIYEYLVGEGYIKEDDCALKRFVEIVCQIDHGFDNYKWSDSSDDRYEFLLHNILTGWKILYPRSDEKYVEWTIHALESIYKILQLKVKAERQIDEGCKFQTKWGKGIAVYTENESVLDLAIKLGYAVAVRKDPGRGHIRVTGSNKHDVDLTSVYKMLKKADPSASWFLHASKMLLRNGSSRNPTMKASKLTIDDLIEILKKA